MKCFKKLIFSILAILACRFSYNLYKAHFNNNIILTYGMTNEYMNSNSLEELILVLKQASKDKRVKGIAIHYRNGIFCNRNIVLSDIAEINQLFDLFRKNNKFVHLYMSELDFSSLYLAAHASKVTLNDQEESYISGLHWHIPFMRNLLKSQGEHTELLITGEFKTPENEVRNHISDEYKDGATEVLKAEAQIVIDDVKQITGIKDFDSLMGIHENTTIAKLAHFQTANNYTTWKNEYKNTLSIFQYANTYRLKRSKEKIVILDIAGPISANATFCQMNFYNKLDQIAKSKQIKGVIVRIDSGGGDAYHSYELYSALKNLAKHKLLVASIKGVSASGSYMAAIAAGKIIAPKSAIVGSIGVIGSHTYITKPGVNIESINSHMPDINSSAPLTTLQREQSMYHIKRAIQKFRALVAKERNFSIEYSNQISLGQIYTGKDALNLGLIDANGTFLDALDYVQKKQKLNEYEVVFLK